jgi:hypothetical protein
MKKRTEVDVFMVVYDRDKRKSVLSGEDLEPYENTKWFISCFAHVIPKNGVSNLVFPNREIKDKLLRHNEGNVISVTPVEHYLIDHGTHEQRKKHEDVHNMSFKPYYELKEKLISEIKQILENGDY